MSKGLPTPIIGPGVKTGSSPSAKTVPNPYGKTGKPPRQNVVAELKANIDARGNYWRQKEKVTTLGYTKSSRYIDLVEVDPNGNLIARFQLGRQTMKEILIARERTGISDIYGAESAAKTALPPITFVPNSLIGLQ